MPNCPECVFKKRNVIIEEHKDDEDVNLNQLLDEVEVLMKFDPVTKHFICKRCGLYATREQVGDIRERINRKESTREDKQYDYLSWWQKSKKRAVHMSSLSVRSPIEVAARQTEN